MTIYSAKTYLEATKNIDWCLVVVDDIREKARKWKKSAGRDATPTVQGCIALLVVSNFLHFLF